MDRENSTIRMEGCTTENGRKTKWMGSGHFIISQGSWLTRACGGRTSFKEKASSTMSTLMPWKARLISPTSTKSTSIGLTTKVVVP